MILVIKLCLCTYQYFHQFCANLFGLDLKKHRSEIYKKHSDPFTSYNNQFHVHFNISLAYIYGAACEDLKPPINFSITNKLIHHSIKNKFNLYPDSI